MPQFACASCCAKAASRAGTALEFGGPSRHHHAAVYVCQLLCQHLLWLCVAVMAARVVRLIQLSSQEDVSGILRNKVRKVLSNCSNCSWPLVSVLISSY